MDFLSIRHNLNNLPFTLKGLQIFGAYAFGAFAVSMPTHETFMPIDIPPSNPANSPR
jgi:hypothetical protein